MECGQISELGPRDRPLPTCEALGMDDCRVPRAFVFPGDSCLGETSSSIACLTVRVCLKNWSEKDGNWGDGMGVFER